ncbi:MAG: apolipoprotein N-acyltransferase [Deltaproteobacteria bacterium]|nr:MAG: apolipoprotein N-acyltransferase [Deltaproteobacteria bacterium]
MFLSMGTITYKDVGLAILCGLLMTASFAPLSLDWLAWVFLIPLFLSLKNKSPWDSFKLGGIAGLSHYLTLIYWIIVVLSYYGGLNPVFALSALLLLSLYLALYIACFGLIWNTLQKDQLAPVLAAASWVGLEYARTFVMSGFPWCLLGYSQYLRLPLIQISDIAGVYGISFLIVMVNVAIFKLISFVRPDSIKAKVTETGVVILIMAFTLVYGYNCLGRKAATAPDTNVLRIAVVQGNIDQSLKWNPELQEKTLLLYGKLTEESVDFKPKLIIWPETALPFFFQDNTALSREVFRIAAKMHSNILFGSPAYTRNSKGTHYYNRAYFISEGTIYDYYDKVHLVPFGEYVPLKRFLPFVNRLVPAAGDFSSGGEVKPISAAGLRIGPIICFEAIFPDISRKHSKQGAQLLVNLTNDAWFGRTSAPYQHISMAVFRCVETALPMARAANTGISAIILPTGKIIARGGLFTKEVLCEELTLDHAKTFYSQFGDIFAILLTLLAILKLVGKFIHKRR